MQTFLPSPSFAESARVLDRARLGKQRVETLQITKAIVTGTGWVNHPVTRMWTGNLGALFQYQAAICNEWTSRGYKDTCLQKTADLIGFDLSDPEPIVQCECCRPYWLGDPDFHLSHRSNLLRKNPDHYRIFWPDDPDDLPYVWPR